MDASSEISSISSEAVALVQRRLGEAACRVDEQLERYIPDGGRFAAHIPEAMRHSLAGGKRSRPLVVLQSAETFGRDGEAVLPTACGFELLHTATLIHDDLPAIDNSGLRRGRPSCHSVFDEATAILAGDALIIAAYQALAAQSRVEGIAAQAVLRVISEFSSYTGAAGLIGGEAADIRGEALPAQQELLEYIHLNKTAKLFEASARAGAILAQASDEQIQTVGSYGQRLGFLFQVTDDILDVTSTVQALGKPVGLDEAAGKQTYPALVGLEEAKRYTQELAGQALRLADRLPANRQLWRGLVKLVLERRS